MLTTEFRLPRDIRGSRYLDEAEEASHEAPSLPKSIVALHVCSTDLRFLIPAACSNGLSSTV